MKLIKHLVFPIVMLLVISCTKKEDIIIYEAGNQEFGWAIGTKEGIQWEASGFWRYHLNDSTHKVIKFVTYSSDGAQRENFTLSYLPLSVGTFSVKNIPDLANGVVHGSFSMFEGDASIGGLDVNENEDSFITISEVNTSTNTIKGSFEIHFISDDGELKVEIKDGEFEVRPYE